MDEFYRVPLTSAEVLTTLAALRVLKEALSRSGAVSDIEPDVLDSAIARITEEIPEFLGPQADRLATALQRTLVESNLVGSDSDSEEKRESPPFPVARTRRLLEEAWERRVPVEIEYYVTSRNEWTIRRVDIADVYAQHSGWYLSGHCGLRRGDFRQFRLDHIRAVRVLDAEDDLGVRRSSAPEEMPDPFEDE